jgi:hypothetical protein
MAMKKTVTKLTRPDFKAGVQGEIDELEKKLAEMKAKQN